MHISAVITGLTPGTTYHYRLVASNSAGTTVSTDGRFATLAQLPDGRAYEQISPVPKQSSGWQAGGASISGQSGFEAAPDGQAVSSNAPSSYSELTNALSLYNNVYLFWRRESGWVGSQGMPPASLMTIPGLSNYTGFANSASLQSTVACGSSGINGNVVTESSFSCARRGPEGQWASTPFYTAVQGCSESLPFSVKAFSGDLHTVVMTTVPGCTLLPEDTNVNGGGSVYSVTGVGTLSPAIHLVSILPNGEANNQRSPSGTQATFVGSFFVAGSAFNAISTDGRVIYFSAIPPGAPAGVTNVYARIDGSHTVDVSDPSPAECTTCIATPAKATYLGASADGSKVFFETAQQLTDVDTDSTPDIYEYDFDEPAGHHVIQVSGGGVGDPSLGSGADVEGEIAISSNGSHVYFVATGVLTTLLNAVGQEASAGANNLYGYDTETGQTKFISSLPSSDASQLWEPVKIVAEPIEAQTTPDGRYLLFASNGRLTPDDTDRATDIYRYDFQTEGLHRISIGEPAFPVSNDGNTEGMGAKIPPIRLSLGGRPDFGDINRAISEDGSVVIFETPEQLQTDDVNQGASPACGLHVATGCDVYEWQEDGHGECREVAGCVRLVSDGQSPTGVGPKGEVATVMSASGSDIFFATETALVAQDTDELVDVYDARVGGGIVSQNQLPAESCGSIESCRGTTLKVPTSPGPPSSAAFSGPGNQPVPVAKKHKRRRAEHKRHHRTKHKRHHRKKKRRQGHRHRHPQRTAVNRAKRDEGGSK